MNKRVLHGGTADLMGQRINGLIVGDYVSRNPFRWATTCERCKTQGTHPHVLLMNGGARCLNTGCGKDNLRDAATDTPRKARARAEAIEAAKQKRIADQKDAALAEVEAQYKESALAISRAARERITTATDHDAFVDPATIGVTMTKAAANDFNVAEYAKFVAQTPGYFHSQKNLDTLAAYLDRNQINIVSALTFAKAADKLREFGLLEERPAPTTQTSEAPVVAVEHDEPTPTPEKSTVTGIDPATGALREYTTREVYRMDSATYRKCFAVSKNQLNALPTRNW